MMKKIAKKLIVTVLGWQVRRLRKKHRFLLIGVAGSIGKTSTKFAIATLLKSIVRVRFQEGNYNDIVSVPLVFFGQKMPSLLNPFAWTVVLAKNERSLRKQYPYEVVIVELGTDGPGQILEFSKYLAFDFAVITAVVEEHMEFFDTITEVAQEEFSITKFSRKVLYNSDLCDDYMPMNSTAAAVTYGVKTGANYTITPADGQSFKGGYTIKKDGEILISSPFELHGSAGVYNVCAAVAVAAELGIAIPKIDEVIRQIQPVNGRLRRLKGVNESAIIDDTYNASPVAVKAALDILYTEISPQRIAILGNMNELGDYSKTAHTEVGEYCDPSRLDVVVTIGPDANNYLAEAAEKRGCRVARFTNPFVAGNYVKEIIRPGAVVLAKGSQNGVFAEEAVKMLLADIADEKYLVRQGPEWLKKKRRYFGFI